MVLLPVADLNLLLELSDRVVRLDIDREGRSASLVIALASELQHSSEWIVRGRQHGHLQLAALTHVVTRRRTRVISIFPVDAQLQSADVNTANRLRSNRARQARDEREQLSVTLDTPKQMHVC